MFDVMNNEIGQYMSGHQKHRVSAMFRDMTEMLRAGDAVYDGSELRQGVADDRLLWANDHPHSDSTWPDSQAMLDEHTAGMDERQRDRIVRANTAALYGAELP